MNYLSVCSGIEAATVAWHPLGWRPLAFAEIEKFPSAVLRHHFREVPNLGDFTRIATDAGLLSDDGPRLQCGGGPLSSHHGGNKNRHRLSTGSDHGRAADLCIADIRPGTVDLLVGGTPCQDFSVAGLRAGMDGARGQLTIEFALLAERLRPRWILWENVPGILSVDQGRAFGIFLWLLGKCGYGFAYRILDAQYWGVPQRRRRLFLVGHLGDWRGPAAVLFEWQSLQGYPAPSRKEGQGVATSIEECPDRRGEEVSGAVSSKWSKQCGGPAGDECYNLIPVAYEPYHDEHEGRGATFKSTDSHPALRCGNGTDNTLAVTPILECQARTGGSSGKRAGMGIGAAGDPMFTLQGKQTHAIAFAQNSRDEVREMPYAGALSAEPGAKQQSYVCTLDSELNGGEDLVGPLKAISPTGGGVKPAVAFTCSDQSNGFAWESDVYPALQAHPAHDGSNIQQGIRHNMAVRRLTPRECERLQGFEDDYTKISANTPDGPRYRALGNSMAVPCMRWLGKRIQMVDELCEQPRLTGSA